MLLYIFVTYTDLHTAQELQALFFHGHVNTLLFAGLCQGFCSRSRWTAGRGVGMLREMGQVDIPLLSRITTS